MKTMILLALSGLFSLGASAQARVSINLQGEKTVNIGGSSFEVSLDDNSLTAALVEKSYRVKDTKYPLVKKRKFEGIDKTRSVDIPSKVVYGKVEYDLTTIGSYVFAGFANVRNVRIPGSVTAIEDYAFFASSVESVTMPSSVEYLGKRVFGHCPNLKRLTMPRADMASSDLFAESKDVEVSVAEYKSVVQKRPQKSVEPKVENVYASVSDVDVDVPVNKGASDETFVLIIANENYEKVSKVNCALNDGRTFRKYCENVLCVPSTNIHYVEDATLGNMLEEVNWLARIAKAYDGDAKLVLYYAGHGIPNESDGSSFLLPIDVAGNNFDGAFSLEKLYATLGGLNAKCVTLFMDACFSGSQRGDGMLMAARGVAIKSKAEAPLGNMVVFSAAQGDETAYPYAEKGHGLFTYFLLKKLKETRGDVDYGTLGDYIQREVGRRSVVVNSKSQTPTVSCSPAMSGKWRALMLK